MPKQPLRTNEIVSRLKSSQSPVVYGTATNAIDALQASLNSPTPIGAWVCQTTEGEKSLSVIDLGSSAYLGLDIDPKLGYINCYLASGAIIGNGDKGNQIKGPLFHFLSREDVNDTATQLTTAEHGNDPVIPNPSGEATATLTKLQVGETIFEIDSGSDVYEYALSASETAELIAGLMGEDAFNISLGIDYTEALKHPAIRLVAEADVDLDHIKLEALLVEIAQAYVNHALVDVSYQSSREMGLAGRTAFDLNLVTEEDSETGDLHVLLKGEPYQAASGGELYVHTIGVYSNSFHSGDPVYNFTIISSRATAYDDASLCAWLKDNGYISQGAGTSFPNSGYELASKAPAFEGESGIIGLYASAGIYSSDGTTLNLILYGSKASLTTNGSTVTAAYNGYTYVVGYSGSVRRDTFYKIS